MCAEPPPPAFDIRPQRLRVPAPAVARLCRRLAEDRAAGRVSTASATYGVNEVALSELVDYWCDDFELEAEPLRGFDDFVASAAGVELSFVHQRSAVASATPLLLLPGFWGRLIELEGLVAALTRPASHGGALREAFHVVCPEWPGFEGGSGDRGASAGGLASACAALMSRLGYDRYLIHGSGLGASLAARVAATDPEHVLALHVTSLQAYPSELELRSLTQVEKSQLAGLTAIHDQLRYALPESPVEDLAYALSELADSVESGRLARGRDTLLRSLSLLWALGDAGERRLLAPQRLRPAPSFRAPVAIDTFPLDAPLLRRFAEAKFHVLRVREHATGGSLVALEAPEVALDALRSCIDELC
jgi:epoxide hydrolase